MKEASHLLTQLIKDEQFPSATAVIVRGNEVVWQESVGVADIESERAASAETIYHLGSVTKLFTAVLLMQLETAGKLTLSDTLVKHLPAVSNSALHPITLQQLVSHTSGLPMMPPIPKMLKAMQTFPPTLESLRQMHFPDVDELLQSLDDVELQAEPGSEVAYSNLGVALLAFVLERVGERPYSQLLHENILNPLNMTSSGLWEEMENHPQLATCYLPFGDPPLAAPPEMKRIKAFVPTGGLCASASDMARFMSAFLREDGTLLPSDKKRQMVTAVQKTEDSRYTDQNVASGVGIGWFLSDFAGATLADHGGADPSTAAYLGIVPVHNIGLFLATNSGKNPAALGETGKNLLKIW